MSASDLAESADPTVAEILAKLRRKSMQPMGSLRFSRNISTPS
jgi:hypothetical protein